MKATSSRARVLAVLLACVLALVGAGAALPIAALAEEGAYSAAEPPSITSPRALVVELETDTTLFERDADERCYPASITKVMTAIVVLENADLDAEVTVEESDFDELTWDSSVAGLKPGETLSVRDLLACLLLPSGNDAAYVLARYVGGGDWRAFVDLMNEKAAELGCGSTHFVNPCGLHDDDHYTTARDLVTIFEEALSLPEFVEIAGSATWDLPATSENPARTLETTDHLVDPDGPVYLGDTVIASKTGTTTEAGRCLITAARRDGRTLVAVVLGVPYTGYTTEATENFYDMYDLIEWGFGAWKTGEVVSVGDALGSAEVTLSSDGEKVDVSAGSAITATVPVETELSDLTLAPSWSEAFQAPLAQGQELGTMTVSLGERDLGTVTATAASAMALSIPSFVIWWLTSDILHAVIAVACLVAVFVVLGLIASARSRARRARRRVAPAGYRRGAAQAPSRTRLSTPPTRTRGGSQRRSGGSHLRR